MNLKFDDKNANRGTERGRELVRKSLQKYGAGRSILVDKNGKVIAGNKTLEQAIAEGIEIEMIKSDGKRLIVHQRTDLDLDKDQAARELAIADNRTSEIGLDWDFDLLAEMTENFLEGFDFDNAELTSPNGFGDSFTLADGDRAPFQQMTFTLADAQAEEIKAALSNAQRSEEYKYMETHNNENSNGNALALIIEQWAEQKTLSLK